MPLLICSNEFPDFVFSGQAIYTAKQLWVEHHNIDDATRLVEVNETTKLIFPNHTHADFLIVDSDNNVLATIHKSSDKENQKPVSSVFWYGDNSINLVHVTDVATHGDTTFVCTISHDCENSIRLSGENAQSFIAQYKAFTAK